MTIMYLADTATNKQRGVYDGTTAPSGTVDTGIMWNDSRDEWTGSAWVLPTSIREQDERDWRTGELLKYDKRMLIRRNNLDRGDTPEDIGPLSIWVTELKDMPAQSGFPVSHTRPTEPTEA